jgi:hypothetical protein
MEWSNRAEMLKQRIVRQSLKLPAGVLLLQISRFKRYRIVCCTVQFCGNDVLYKCYCVIHHTVDLKHSQNKIHD